MRISEIFYSVQGEGSLVGVPSVFVRTSGCNLRCTWCDTPYTSWAPEGRQMTADEIVAEVLAHRASQHVVVTGGEPMLTDEIVALTQALRAAGQHITIETAGTVHQDAVCDLYSISPKLSNSTPFDREGGRFAIMHDNARWRPEVIRSLVAVCEYQLKFVVCDPVDLNEIEPMIAEVKADASRVILMPEGRDAATLLKRSTWLIEICKDRGYRFSPRLHVDLWGSQRGV